jgi:O-antigen/teichoic acid export membrane protein
MSLRTKVLRGGAHLTLRQLLGVVIATVGTILLARALGPGAYGIYAAALGIYSYLNIVCRWGVHVYLIRHQGEPQPQDYHQAFSLLFLTSLAGAGSAIVALPFLERWIGLEGFGPVATALFASLPVGLLQLVPLARLERALDYRRVAPMELAGQVITYAVALPLAYRGLGPWAPVAGLWAQQLLTLSLFYWASAYRPKLYWESARVRAMVGYGLGYSVSDWIWYLRVLVNPLVVGRFAGAEAVGYVALAIRLAEQVSLIIVAAAHRLSIAAFARFQEDRARLARAVAEGTSLQMMAVGPLLAGLGLVAPWVVSPIFGPRWLPVVEIYPFIALGYLSGAVFSLQTSALFVLRRTWEVAIVSLVHLTLFAGSALLLVPHLGVVGYGWAEVGALPSYILLLIWFRTHVGKPISLQTGAWSIAWAAILFTWQLGPWVWASVIVLGIWPASRRELLQALALVLRRPYRN